MATPAACHRSPNASVKRSAKLFVSLFTCSRFLAPLFILAWAARRALVFVVSRCRPSEQAASSICSEALRARSLGAVVCPSLYMLETAEMSTPQHRPPSCAVKDKTIA